MMWSTFISKKLSFIVSKSKVDKLNGFSSPEKNLLFLRVCVTFLDCFMEANVLCEGVQPPKNPVLKNHWSSDASASLTDLALIQPQSNYEMILLHYQVALCTQFIHTFKIKKSSMKPSNMFDTKVCYSFFITTDLTNGHAAVVEFIGTFTYFYFYRLVCCFSKA